MNLKKITPILSAILARRPPLAAHRRIPDLFPVSVAVGRVAEWPGSLSL
jgi:hypothetical protein